MYQRRLNQGYNSIPRNWIEFNKLKKWNEMTILKRLLWKIGLVDEPSIQYWDTTRTNISRLSHYNKSLQYFSIQSYFKIFKKNRKTTTNDIEKQIALYIFFVYK